MVVINQPIAMIAPVMLNGQTLIAIKQIRTA